MLTRFHNRQQQTATSPDNNSGQSDPYVSFLQRQATQKAKPYRSSVCKPKYVKSNRNHLSLMKKSHVAQMSP